MQFTSELQTYKHSYFVWYCNNAK